jgi:Zn-dependent protease
MGRSWKIGRAFGIPLYVHPTFLLLLPIAALNAPPGNRVLALAFSILLMLVVFGCVLLHELGHALAARFFGIGTRDITLYPIGGMARLERLNERPIEELVIALAGPAVNLLIALLLAPVLVALALAGGFQGPMLEVDLAGGWWPLASRFLLLVWAANILLAVFNMIPAFPMDGGRVLRAVLAHFFGYLRGTEIAVAVGAVMAGLIAATAFMTGFNPVPILIALFVIFAGRMELFVLRQREAARQQAEATRLSSLPIVAELSTLRPYRPGFTGLTWDGKHRVWIRWDAGRAVAIYAGRSE